MASNQDYYGGYSNQVPVSNTPSPAPYNHPHHPPQRQQPTPAPSYHSAYPEPSSQYNGHYGAPSKAPPPPSASPFDTVFDDHTYPSAGSTSNISQQELHQDTGYYGQGGASPASRAYGNEDIPLQEHPNKQGDINDHVYDAPPGAQKGGQRNKKRVAVGQLGMIGADRKGIPWVVYIFSTIQLAVFIAEIVRNGILTGSPIQIKPQFNPMIGPSPSVMINMGARYVPCMHNIEEIQGSTTPVLFACPNATKSTEFCPLSELCGFGGVPNPLFNGDVNQGPQPNQWYRFIIPIFMHAGIIHIGFNLLLQLTLGKEMEIAIGPVRFLLVYLSAGIFGFVMGGNFAAPAIASTGASGSLFGIIALTLIDLLYSWSERKSPIKDLMYILLDMIIAFVLGLLPGLDNFSHIGGFLMGLALGICVLHSPNSLRRRLDQDLSYAAVNTGNGAGPQAFMKSPVGFFKGRKPLWWAWWLVRAAALILIIVVFVVLLNNFYTAHHTCKWCKYLSCLPVNHWCELGTIQQVPNPAATSSPS